MSRDGRRRNPAARHGARGPAGHGGGAGPGGYSGSDPYGAPDDYANRDGYSEPGGYSGPQGYGPADSYQTGDRYAPSDGYAAEDYTTGGYAQNGYAQNGYAQDGYAQDGYAQDGYAQDGYRQSGGYAPSDGYAGSEEYAGNGYGAGSHDGYAPADGYGRADGYGQPDGYAAPDAYAQGSYATEATGQYEQDRYASQDTYREDHYAPSDPYAKEQHPSGPLPQEEHGRRDADNEGFWEDSPNRDGFIPGLDERRGGRRKRRLGRVVAPLLAVVMLAAVAVAGYKLYPRFHTADYPGDGAGEVMVHVPSGASAFSLAPELVQLGVVASTRAFVDAAKASSNPDGLQPGYYNLHKHMKASLAYALLLNPSSKIQTTIAIPEGLRLTQILSLLQSKAGSSVPANAYANAMKDTKALGLPPYARLDPQGYPEGYLFPATYEITPGESPLTVLQQMVARFNEEAQTINLPAAAAAGHNTAAQIITIASILEAEGSPRYYAQIAEVIYNRLNQGINLGLDSTVNYALNRFGVSLTQTQLHVNSPYNTVIHPGLPPGPIDSPGDAAIQAALHPAHGDLLYFVTVNLKTGLTLFTNNAAQFNADVALCQQNHAC